MADAAAVDALWAALGATPAVLAALDERLRVQALTPAAAELLGVDAGAMRGRAIDEVLAAAGDAAAGAAVARLAGEVAADGGARRFAGMRPARRAGALEVVLDLAIAGGGGAIVVHLTDAAARARHLGDADALRALVQRARGHAIFLLDADGRVATWNPGAQRLKGYAAEEILGQHFSRLYRPEDAAAGRPERNLERARREGSARDEWWRRRKDGGDFWADVEITRLDDAAGRVRGFAKVVQDRSDERAREERARRQADELGRLAARLAESEERFRLLVDGVREYAIVGTDAEGRITSWNAGGERLFGWGEAEAIGRDAAIIFTPEDRDAAVPQREIQHARLHGQAMDERWHVRRDGTRFYASGVLTALRDDRGVLHGFVKIVRDRTAERRTEEALRTERAVLAAVLDQMPVGVSVAEAPSGRVLFHNKRGIELLGHGVLHGEGWRAYAEYGAVHPDGRPYAAEEYPTARTILKGEPVEREEMRYRRPDGTVVDFAVSSAPVRQDGVVVRSVTTFMDVTDRKRERDSLARVNRELEEFASMASHDLQEPLRMVASYLTLLRRRAADALDAPSRQYLDEAVGGAQRMQRLVKHLLDFARVDRGDPRLEPTPVLQAVAAAMHNLERAIDESRAVVTHDDLPVVLAEPEHLVRLFQNLIGNAVKYARPGAPPRVHVGARADGARWRIAITDNGVGIKATDRERVFRPFERAHGRERYPGTGLGLAICRKIVDRCGGDIRIEEGPQGVGTRFVVTLRASDAARG